MNMVRNLAQAKAPQRLAPSQGMLAFSPAEIRPFLHHKSAGPHHRRGILRLSGRQRRNGAEVGPDWCFKQAQENIKKGNYEFSVDSPRSSSSHSVAPRAP